MCIRDSINLLHSGVTECEAQRSGVQRLRIASLISSPVHTYERPHDDTVANRECYVPKPERLDRMNNIEMPRNDEPAGDEVSCRWKDWNEAKNCAGDE